MPTLRLTAGQVIVAFVTAREVEHDRGGHRPMAGARGIAGGHLGGAGGTFADHTIAGGRQPVHAVRPAHDGGGLRSASS